MTTASNGAEIFWSDRGEGPVLVLLHGNGEDSSIFSPIIPELAKKRRVIAMDSRGHGKSSAGGQKLRLADMAEDLIHVLDDAGAAQADLAGFSDGGNIALLAAVQHPERVRAMVLSGANSDPSGLLFSIQAKLWLRHTIVTLGTLFSPKCCREKELLDLMLYEPKLSTADLQGLCCPVLVTAGEHDMIRAAHTQYLHACIPGSQMHIFPGGHFTPIKRPALYLEAVAGFLDEVSPC